MTKFLPPNKKIMSSGDERFFGVLIKRVFGAYGQGCFSKLEQFKGLLGGILLKALKTRCYAT